MKNYNLKLEDSLLLFIDIQDKILNSIFNNEDLLKNSIILSKAADIMDLDTLITLQYPKGLGDVNDLIAENLKDTKKIDKITFSCMLNEEFVDELKNKNKKQIIICGIEAHICVLFTARDLLKAGYEVFLIEDALGSRKKENYENALNQLNDMGCVVTNLESVLFDLNSIAGTPTFKQIQKLIK